MRPRFSAKVCEEPQRRERKWGNLQNQDFSNLQTQDYRACDGGGEENRTPQPTSFPAEPKRERKAGASKGYGVIA